MAGTRLVLIMGGGVSLGTYLAGALTEIFWALRHTNGDLAAPDRRREVRVDVLAGASAGAMSAAIFARALTADTGAIGDLRRAWVEEISIRELLRKGPSGFHPLALFSPAKIDELAQRLITPPADTREWQPFCAPTLRIAFTLTNLGGVRYRIAYANHEDAYFTTRIHSDLIRLELHDPPEPGELDRVWPLIRDAAVASGAFPAAFPPRSLPRDLEDYRPPTVDPSIASPAPMWYVDGGVLDNEPIGVAKDLVERDPEHQQYDYRYILIDPYLDSPLNGLNDRLHEAPASLFAVLGDVAAAVMGQGTAKDWLRANKTNWRLDAHVEFVTRRLRPLVVAARDAGGDVAQTLAAGLREQARAIAAFKRGVNRPTPPTEAEVEAYFAANRERIRNDPRYAAALDGLDVARDAMLDAIFIIESAAGLRDKEPMDLYLIAPRGRDEHPLAGDFLRNFGGFFRQEWREHDFLCGRRDARAVLLHDLRARNGDGTPGEPLFDYPPEDGVDYDPPPLDIGPGDLTAEERRLFHDYLKGRFEPLVAPHLPWYLRPFRGRIANKAAREAMRQLGFPG